MLAYEGGKKLWGENLVRGSVCSQNADDWVKDSFFANIFQLPAVSSWVCPEAPD